MKDITSDHYDDIAIYLLIMRYVPRKPAILYPIKKMMARNILKKYRMYQLSSIRELVDNYEFLNKKTSFGLWRKLGMSGMNNYSGNEHSMDDIMLYNQYARPEMNSRSKNLNYCVLEDVGLNIDSESFVRNSFFELCELQLTDYQDGDRYFPVTFIYRDEVKNIEKDNLKNTAMLEIMLNSDMSQKYDLTLQTMDEGYPVYKDGMVLLRGKRAIIKDINIHDDEGYDVPDYEPLLISVFE